MTTAEARADRAKRPAVIAIGLPVVLTGALVGIAVALDRREARRAALDAGNVEQLHDDEPAAVEGEPEAS